MPFFSTSWIEIKNKMQYSILAIKRTPIFDCLSDIRSNVLTALMRLSMLCAACRASQTSVLFLNLYSAQNMLSGNTIDVMKITLNVEMKNSDPDVHCETAGSKAEVRSNVQNW